MRGDFVIAQRCMPIDQQGKGSIQHGGTEAPLSMYCRTPIANETSASHGQRPAQSQEACAAGRGAKMTAFVMLAPVQISHGTRHSAV